MSRLFASSGLVLALVLSACSGAGGVSEAADAQQTTSPASTPDAGEATDTEGDSETEPSAADGETSIPTDDPGASDDGPTTIGGADTGLTLEVPDEWVEVPTDGDVISEGLEGLDLSEDQAAFLESSMNALGDLEGAVMAVDTSTYGAGVATNVNAYCIPNDGSVGDNNLEVTIELSLESIAEEIEIGNTTVDGISAVRATYRLDMAQVQGSGVQYVFLHDGDICWVTFTAADESRFGEFEDIAATISLL